MSTPLGLLAAAVAAVLGALVGFTVSRLRERGRRELEKQHGQDEASRILKRAEEVAREENRSKSELLREALRFYVDTREIRKTAVNEWLFAVIDEIQARTKRTRPGNIRRIVREAVQAARHEGRHRAS